MGAQSSPGRRGFPFYSCAQPRPTPGPAYPCSDTPTFPAPHPPLSPRALQANLACPLIEGEGTKLQFLTTTRTAERLAAGREVLSQIRDANTACTIS